MCSDETGLLHMLLISFLYLVSLLQIFLSYEQLRAASLIGRNAGTCRPAKSDASRVRLTLFDESYALTMHSGNLMHFQRKTISLMSQVFSFCGEK